MNIFSNNKYVLPFFNVTFEQSKISGNVISEGKTEKREKWTIRCKRKS